MSQLKKLQKLLVAKLGVADRTRAEYVLAVSRKGASQLRTELADFPPDLVNSIIDITNPEPQRLFPSKTDTKYSGIVLHVADDSLTVGIRAPASYAGKQGVVKQAHQCPVGSQVSGEILRTHPEIELSLANTKRGLDPESGTINLTVDRKVPHFLQDESLTTQAKTFSASLPEARSWLAASAKHTTSKLLESVRSRDAEVMTIPHSRDGSAKTSSAEPTGTCKELPVHAFENAILEATAQNPVCIIVGDTGSGKTTQITQFMNRSGYSAAGKMVACTQPRRLAAISIAERVAEEMHAQPVGGKVGYAVRFDDTTSNSTEVKYMTDGLLLREVMTDPDLQRYSVIMLDEAHERTISTDVLFALLKTVLARRPDLRILVTSATLDAEKFSMYFGGAPILRIPGRTFPVEIEYLEEPILDYMEAAIDTVHKIHSMKTSPEDKGDILVFLTGQAEIEQAYAVINKRYPQGDLYAVPVYAAIPSEMQSLIFNPAPEGKRKVVLATNIAETSLTIDGIRYVVDPGFAKVQVWDTRRGMGVLKVQPISQAQANQRAGRAGRTAPGVCYRLYTKASFDREMLPSTAPEILRANLGYTVLLLKSMGIDDILRFDFMDSPPRDALISSLEELYLLGAIDGDANITDMGRKMARLPLDPSLAKVVVVASTKGRQVLEDVLTIVAMLSMPSVFYRPTNPASKKAEAERAHQQMYNATGDHITLLNVYQKWVAAGANKKWCDKNYIQFKILLKVKDVLHQLRDNVRRSMTALNRANNSRELTFKERGDEAIKVLCAGFFQNIAKRQSGNEGSTGRGDYLALNSDVQVSIHPSSVLFHRAPPYLLYTSLILTSKEYMHTVSQVKPEWLIDAAPEVYKQENEEDARKRQRSETIRPLFNRFSRKEDDWRVSKQKETLMRK